jgi:fatty aldehyde-generating acyl-ACP reductase
LDIQIKLRDKPIIRRFALLGHPRDYGHLYSELKCKIADLKEYSPSYIVDCIDQTEPFITDFWGRCIDNNNLIVSGFHVAVPITPEFITGHPKQSIEKIKKAIVVAANANANVVTLGGLTSVIFRKNQALLSDEYDIKITTGNTLTCAVTVKLVEKVASIRGIRLDEAVMAVIGASGDIGTGCCLAFHRRVKTMILCGRNLTKLARLESNLDELGTSTGGRKVDKTTRIVDAVRDADIVITVTSTPDLPLGIENFKKGTIVCDVGYPKNINFRTNINSDVFVFDGGLVSIPFPIHTQVDLGISQGHTMFGCYAEGILLAIDDKSTISKESWNGISVASMEQIYEIALRNNFREIQL